MPGLPLGPVGAWPRRWSCLCKWTPPPAPGLYVARASAECPRLVEASCTFSCTPRGGRAFEAPPGLGVRRWWGDFPKTHRRAAPLGRLQRPRLDNGHKALSSLGTGGGGRCRGCGHGGEAGSHPIPGPRPQAPVRPWPRWLLGSWRRVSPPSESQVGLTLAPARGWTSARGRAGGGRASGGAGAGAGAGFAREEHAPRARSQGD